MSEKVYYGDLGNYWDIAYNCGAYVITNKWNGHDATYRQWDDANEYR